jgi:diketogulonate reductase-like aldo/keto reductase
VGSIPNITLGNEAEVGEAIAGSGLDRGEVFVTSKFAGR